MAELALLAAMAAAGFALSRGTTEATAARMPTASHFEAMPRPSGATLGSIALEVGARPPPDEGIAAMARQELAQNANTRLEAVLDNTNAPIAGDRRFVFTSAKSQAYRPEVTQRKMELFTGAMDAQTSATGQWKHKRETMPLFRPSAGYAPVTSSGVGIKGVSYDRSEYERFVSGKQNNVLPAPQVTVGPGIGIPLEQAAGNGFHNTINRVLPRNINEHKINKDMPGRVGAAGNSHVPVRQRAVPVSKNNTVKYWTLDRRPLAPGRATATAHTLHAREPRAGCFGTKRDAEERDYQGVATHALTKSGPVDAHLVRATRPEVRCDDPVPLPSINPTGSQFSRTPGGYTHASYDCNRFIRQQREKTAQKEGPGNIGGTLQRGTLPTVTYALQPTNRSLAPSYGCTRPERGF